MTYQFSTSSGDPIATVADLEIDKTGHVHSVPVLLVDHVTYERHCFIIAGDLSNRFVQGFSFTVSGSTPFDGEYVCAIAGSSDGKRTWIFVDNIPKPQRSAAPQQAETTGSPAFFHKPIIKYVLAAQRTPLVLIGRGVSATEGTSSWGEIIQQNQLHLLDNFSSPLPPTAPLQGQLWHERQQDNMCWLGSDGEWHELASRKYVDNQIASTTLAGVGQQEPKTPEVVQSTWIQPIIDSNLYPKVVSIPPFSEATSFGKTVIIIKGEGRFSPFSGHAIQWNGSRWVSILGRPVQVGDRFGVMFDHSIEYSDISGTDCVAVVTKVSSTEIQLSFKKPLERTTVAVLNDKLTRSVRALRAYEYNKQNGWVQILHTAPPPVLKVPASSTSDGTVGNVIADDQYVYVYGTHGWRRIPAQSF